MAKPLQHKPDHLQSWPAVSVLPAVYHMLLIPEHMRPLDRRRGAKIVISASSSFSKLMVEQMNLT